MRKAALEALKGKAAAPQTVWGSLPAQYLCIMWQIQGDTRNVAELIAELEAMRERNGIDICRFNDLLLPYMDAIEEELQDCLRRAEAAADRKFLAEMGIRIY